ncbi:hypothetical protein VTN49DRAFT_8057 [Thermomyces lanuginosus]|uniref:uncharacterized protein n=1 Tax=Thermomyces lanuginosus TaxID=5541 RepID=UPI003742233B
MESDKRAKGRATLTPRVGPPPDPEWPGALPAKPAQEDAKPLLISHPMAVHSRPRITSGLLDHRNLPSPRSRILLCVTTPHGRVPARGVLLVVFAGRSQRMLIWRKNTVDVFYFLPPLTHRVRYICLDRVPWHNGDSRGALPPAR